MNIEERLIAILPKVEPKIRPLVEAFIKRGIITASSCEGHLGRDPFPNVGICFWLKDPTSEEINSLKRLLISLGRWNAKRGEQWTITPVYFPNTAFQEGPMLILWLETQEKNLKRDPQILEKLQDEAKEFAEFFLSNE